MRPQHHRNYTFYQNSGALLITEFGALSLTDYNIAIMRAFVEVRRVLLQENDLKEQLKQVKERLGEHDAQLNQIYDAMENLLDEKAAQKKWENREKIGFNK